MKQSYENERGGEIDEAGDIAIRLRLLAGEIYNAKCEAEWLKRQLFASTACGEYLDYIAAQRGLSRRAATKSRGALTFSVEETVDHAISIPRGTTVSTGGASPVRVKTSADSELPANTYSVTVSAEAEEAGFAGNIIIGEAVVPVSMPSGVDSVINNSAFSGGDDAESDLALRERVLASFADRPNGMNAAYYRELAESVEGVEKAGVVERVNGVYTLGVYLCGRGGAVSNEVLQNAAAVIEANRAVNLQVTVDRAGPVDYDLDVTVKAKAGYSAAEVRQAVSAAFVSCVGSTPAGGKMYLSRLGKFLMDTGVIENYQFDSDMQNATVSAAHYFEVGDITIEVT